MGITVIVVVILLITLNMEKFVEDIVWKKLILKMGNLKKRVIWEMDTI